MKIFYTLCIFLLLSFCNINAQTSFDKNKLEFGGAIGASFGDYTSVQISPQVGYAFTNIFSAGFGVSYLYYDYDSFSKNYAGLDLYARLRPIRNIVLQAQPELYRTWGKNIDSKIVPCLLLGGGVILPLGNAGGISFMLSYDVLQNNSSPYRSQLVYSVGYTIGF